MHINYDPIMNKKSAQNLKQQDTSIQIKITIGNSLRPARMKRSQINKMDMEIRVIKFPPQPAELGSTFAVISRYRDLIDGKYGFSDVELNPEAY